MARRLVMSILLVVSLAGLRVGAPPASAHLWSDYCTNSGWGLLNIREHENNQGAADAACLDDDEWGDSEGDIQNFHDRMTSYHIRDRVNPGYDHSCVKVRFYEHPFYTTAFFEYQTHSFGAHHIEDNVGGTWNDRVDSHRLTGTWTPSTVC